LYDVKGNFQNLLILLIFTKLMETEKLTQLFCFLVVSIDENIKIPPYEHDLIYNELKTIIMDHQRVME